MLRYKVRVGFSDCDGLGHVNHAKYFTYMEEARSDIFRFFNPELDVSKWNLIVASARCEFLQQVSYAEELTVLSWISRIGTASFTIEHAITNAAGDFVARGQGILIAYNYASETSQPLWPEVLEKLREHVDEPEGVPAFYAGQ